MKSTKNSGVGYAAAVTEDDRLHQLIEGDWDSISAILYSRTKGAMSRRRFRGELGGPVPGGHEVDDFIQQSILEAYCAMPEWDGERDSLVEILLQIIARHIKRYSSRHENTMEQRSTTNRAEANSHTADISQAEQTCYPEPEAFASDQEEVESIMERFSGHRDAPIVEVILCEDAFTPEEIAEKLKLKVDEVNNAKKRLKRDPYLHSVKRKRDRKKIP